MNADQASETYHGVVMTEEVPNECENVFCCRSACGSALAYGSEVLVCYSAYPALIPRRTLCASGTDGANSCRASGAGLWPGMVLRSFRLHFRERHGVTEKPQKHLPRIYADERGSSKTHH